MKYDKSASMQRQNGISSGIDFIIPLSGVKAALEGSIRKYCVEKPERRLTRSVVRRPGVKLLHRKHQP